MATKKQVGGYILDKKIGKGSFAEVWKGKIEQTGEAVAVKVISRQTVQETAQLKQEVAVLKKLSSPHIVRFKDLKKSASHFYLILEYCNGGDLSSYIGRHGRINESLGRLFLRQLASGLNVLHRHNFIHRDLKPQNILLIAEKPPVLRIADFGFSRALLPQDMATTICGSPLYMAPEILRHEKYDSKADLWSVGAILFECFCGRPPFTGTNPMQLLATIENSTCLDFPQDCSLSQNGRDFLHLLLEKDPQKRVAASSFMEHTYVSSDLDLEETTLCLYSSKATADGVFIERKEQKAVETFTQNEQIPFSDSFSGPGTNFQQQQSTGTVGPGGQQVPQTAQKGAHSGGPGGSTFSNDNNPNRSFVMLEKGEGLMAQDEEIWGAFINQSRSSGVLGQSLNGNSQQHQGSNDNVNQDSVTDKTKNSTSQTIQNTSSDSKTNTNAAAKVLNADKNTKQAQSNKTQTTTQTQETHKLISQTQSQTKTQANDKCDTVTSTSAAQDFGDFAAAAAAAVKNVFSGGSNSDTVTAMKNVLTGGGSATNTLNNITSPKPTLTTINFQKQSKDTNNTVDKESDNFKSEDLQTPQVISAGDQNQIHFNTVDSKTWENSDISPTDHHEDSQQYQQQVKAGVQIKTIGQNLDEQSDTPQLQLIENDHDHDDHDITMSKDDNFIDSKDSCATVGKTTVKTVDTCEGTVTETQPSPTIQGQDIIISDANYRNSKESVSSPDTGPTQVNDKIAQAGAAVQESTGKSQAQNQQQIMYQQQRFEEEALLSHDPSFGESVKRVISSYLFLGERYLNHKFPAESAACVLEACKLVSRHKFVADL